MKPILLLLAVSTAVATSNGCNETAASQSAAAEPLQKASQLAEVDIGEFRIPLPAADQYQADGTRVVERHRLLLRFRLIAVVPSSQEDDVAARLQSHAARLREEVIRTCRAATLDELEEPALITLKGELHKVLARYFGPKHLRQIVVTNVLIEAT